jgi:glyoxylase-like metal-dependent hydrolase (beta-lactamase superfamily II)
MTQQIAVAQTDKKGRPESRILRRSGTNEIVPDVACKRISIVNIVFCGAAGAPDRQWALIDAGMPGTARLIIRAAEKRYGRDSRPAAILLTHGHFDHVGALAKLAEFWDVPIYAHPLEFPYLNGTSSYPPPDPTVGGGLMASLSPLYPRGPINVSTRLKALPEGEAPFMPGWTWLHTPGHSPGHVSFWRESDRTLIAGDAFVTTAQESAYSVAVQQPEMHGPPMYYTPDWNSARESVRKLALLEPEWAVTGHGPPMSGSEMRGALKLLAADFDRIAMPEEGRYVPKAA